MRRDLHLTAKLLDDVEKAAVWYAEQNPETAKRFRAAVRETLLHVEEAPELYPVIQPRLRRALLSRFPYGLYFTLTTEKIVVVACTHHRRHPRRWQSRI